MGTSGQGQHVDVIVVGGGPAGLSAALVLGRARRSVLVLDDGRYRNDRSRGVHGYLSRDGILPEDLRKRGRAELRRYGVRVLGVRATGAGPDPRAGFRVRVSGGRVFRARKLLLATGVRDRIPSIRGIDSLYGVSVHHCPFCDGWEWRDRRLAVYGRGESGAGLAHSLLAWSPDLILFTDGPTRLSQAALAALRRRGVGIRPERVERLQGENGFLRGVLLRGGAAVARDAIFLATPNEARIELAKMLRCRFKPGGSIWTDRRECASVPGVFVAGDASRDVQFAIVAAAEGARAAVAIHRELVAEEQRGSRREKNL
ncbi:MAG TPA: NAD(P)/FAD-dependent oxidoreductase [Candidatus Eisenbacteria bacterium]|nr:NAD(P)/FAD-dependent oxidoreductase [Candidatus Eisenbacteria bacterium]